MERHIRRQVYRSEYVHLLGQQVNILVGDTTYKNKKLFFAGTSMLGKEVITTGCDRAIIEVLDWEKVKIELA